MKKPGRTRVVGHLFKSAKSDKSQKSAIPVAKKKKSKPKKIDLAHALFTPEDVELLATGDDVRVRPAPDFAPAYGQGKNSGPVIGAEGNQVRFAWGQPLRVGGGSGLGDPQKNIVTIACIRLNPDLFLSEQDYQNLKTSSTK